MDERGKKWIALLKERHLAVEPGIFDPTELDTNHGLILASPEQAADFKRNVYQMSVSQGRGSEIDFVHLITDSVEVLKMLGNREFEVETFSWAVLQCKKETIFEIGLLENGEIEFAGKSLRVIPRLEPENSFELRLV